jgi:hypothetical protein
MKRKVVKHYAFWRINEFPYVKGSKGILRDCGLFVPDGDGKSPDEVDLDTFDGVICSGWKPTAIFDVIKQGKELQRKLNQLKEERTTILKLVKRTFNSQLKDLMPCARP